METLNKDLTRAVQRRNFLKAAGIVAASPWMLSANGGIAAESQPAAAQPRLLSGCCAYSYAKYLKTGQMTMEDFIVKAVDLGIAGVDITTYWLKSTDPAYIASLRRFAFKRGVPIWGIGIRNSMCQSDQARRAAEVAAVKKWVDVADGLGASHVRVFGGELPAGASQEQGIGWAVETMKPACDYAAAKGITLGMEDHGGTADIACKAETILEILRRVDSPAAGITLDVANFTENQYHQIAACVPYAAQAHIRDVFEDTKVPIDLDRVWEILAQGGYKGFLSAEYEGDEDPMTGVPKLVAKIKDLCKKYSTV